MMNLIRSRLIVEAISEVGSVKAINQDHVLARVGETNGEEFGIFAVADGMGGLAAGEFASAFAIRELSKWWEVRLPLLLQEDENLILKILEDIKIKIEEINDKIFYTGEVYSKKMGTTLSALFLYKGSYCIVHIGDSRIYKIDNSSIEQMTEDHSYVADLVNKGIITSQEARRHPKRNLLTKCLGRRNKVELMIKTGKVENEESFIVSSDGFYNLLLEEEMYYIFNQFQGNIKKCLEYLTKVIYDRGAYDNLAAIYITRRKEGLFSILS